MKPPKPIKSDDFQRYLIETRGVERDYLGELVNSRRTAWRVAMGFGVCSLLSVAGMLGVIGTYRNPPPPAVFTVDRSTGHVDTMTALADEHIQTSWATDKQYINTYILAREGYDFNALQLLYNTTGLMTSESAIKDYSALYSGPNARDKVLKDGSIITVDIKSIVQGPDKTATVRFATITTNIRNGLVTGPANFIATLAYQYVGAPMKEEDRRIDALGFQITTYHVDPDVVSATVTSAVAMPVGATAASPVAAPARPPLAVPTASPATATTGGR